MNKQEIKETRNTLLDWVWDKYQPKDGFNPFHELFFKDNALTYQEVEDAVDAFVNKNVEVYGDVMCENNDMFCVRDIVLSKRGVDYTALQCGLWIRYYIDNKPVGVVEYRASVKKRKKEYYDDIQQSNPEYVAAVGMRRYSNFEEYWLQEWDRITSGGWVDRVLDKIYNNKKVKINIMNDTQKQIIRQSSLKSAVEWVNAQDTKFSLTELIGITMGFEAYCVDGSFDLLQTIQNKLQK